MIVANGSADVTTYFVLRDATTHAAKTDVTIADIDLYYLEQGAAISAKADVTALAAADSAHADNKGFHVGHGLYRLDWPDAAFDGGVGKSVMLVVVCTGVDTTFLEVELSPNVNVASMADAVLRQLGVVATGTAQSAAAANVVVAAGTGVLMKAGSVIGVLGSTQGYYQWRSIVSVSTDTLTVDAWDVTPSGTITYIVLAAPPASATALPPVSLGTGGITAASFAAGAINAAALAADAGTELATAIWASASRQLTALDEDVTTIDLNNTAVGSVAGAVGSVTGAVGSVTGAVGSVTGAVGSVTGNVGGNVTGSVGSVAGNVGGNVVGSVGTVAGNVGGSVASIASGGIVATSFAAGAIDATALNATAVDELVDQVWDEILSGHADVGSTGAALSAAGGSGDPWSTSIPGAYGAGTAGYIIGSNLNAPVGTVDTVVDAIKAKTDNLPAAPAAVGSAMTLANDAITAAVMASGALDADAIANDAIAEIQSGLATGSSIISLAATTGNIYTDVHTSGVVVAAASKTGYELTTAANNAVADALLDRNMSAGADTGSATVRTIRQALRFLRNRWSVSGGTLTVMKEDDATPSWTAAVTTDAAAIPIVGNDPASS